MSAPSRSACGATEGKIYNVGPTRAILTPKDVPWLKLMPCDQVLIDYRATPYTDIIFIGSRGEKNKYITIKGLPGPNGERPVFDAAGASSSTTMGMSAIYDGAGMIVIGKPSTTAVPTRVYGYKPGYLHITGLSIKNARSAYKYTNQSKVTANWPNFTAAIYVNPAENLAITNCELSNSGLGLFVNSLNDEAGQSRKLLISGNYFHGNGVSGDASLHNSYTEAIGTIYEYNYFGQPISGTAGDNVKDRSAGIVFRYNYMEGGTYGLSLRDPQSNGTFEGAAVDSLGDLLTKHAFVYSNIFRLRGTSFIAVGHGDGVYGDGKQYRHGNLFFYSNKVISEFDYQMYHRDTVPLFQFLNTRSPATAVAVNNLFYAKSATVGGTPAPFSLIFWLGKANFQSNWINNYTNTHTNWGGYTTGVYVGTKYDGSGLYGLTKQSGSPGFTNLSTGDFSSLAGSAFTTLGGTLPTEVVARKLTPAGTPVQFPPLTIAN